ncbi:hypothetical protein AGMMS4952_22470 [Spirochaetia bacterium]|nr:hypothetical protein AGMMS4952_22470 [Spirochaetia bacterium]
MKTFSMKRTRGPNFRYTIGLVLLVGALSGCADPLSLKPVDNSNDAGGGYSLLTVTLGDTAKGGQPARTLYPAVSGFQSYVISFSHGSRSHANETFAPGETITVALDTDAAPWTITVTAYTGTGGSGTASAGGTASVTMDGNAQTANITLTPILGGGTKGTFSYSIAFPTTISSAAVTITTATGGAVSGGVITASSANISAGALNGTLSLDAGYYFMNINLVKGSLGAGKTEVVHLYPGLTTATPDYIFTEADLKPALSGTASVTGGSAPNPFAGEILTADFTSPDGTTGLSYQWKRGDTAVGLFTAIAANANAAAYTVTAADEGKYIMVEVSRTDYDGSISSPAVYVVEPGTIVITAANLDQMKSLVAAAGSGTSSTYPIKVKVTIADASLLSGNNGSGTDSLHKLFDAIPFERYVAYDLSGCTFIRIEDVSWGIAYARTNRVYLASVILPNTLTSIGEQAFSSCYGLTSVTIGNSVISIGRGAFYSCSSLTSVTIPDSVTSIEENTFVACSSLTSVTIGNGVTSIGYQAFFYCSSLTSVTIPNSVTSIDQSAFSNCSSLTSFTVDVGNTYFSSQDGVLFNANKTTLITYPEGKSGTYYTIPNSVTSIGKGAFQLSGLTSVIIPDSVTSIEESAFVTCSSLTSITIPDSVISIGAFAFQFGGLTSIYILRDTAPLTTLSWSVFNNNSASLVIYVPASVVDAVTNGE